ncbi:hypothetical protein [Vulcanisaeta sp. JCM 16161]|uniref:hypothetical protein n=1 Tax=Vulcanisaeta sp. JCM 16161 TaxID=1295372 RepID=UPI000B194B07|nr:hypothetical protein [Vulcanisaeta sp. JCM 16161]
MPKDHWLSLTLLDIIGIILGIGLGLVMAYTGHPNLAYPIGLLATAWPYYPGPLVTIA